MIISNHPTRTDWMWLWALVTEYASTDRLRIMMKASLRNVPGFGYVAQLAQFMFMERKLAKDRKQMYQTMLSYAGNGKKTAIATTPPPFHLLVFPEGSDLSAENQAKDRAFVTKYSESTGFYNYVLHPRVSGFVYCVQTLRKLAALDELLDVTMAYEGAAPSEKQLVQSSFPRAVHMHCRRVSPSELPTSDEDLAEWLRQTFQQKEARLKACDESAVSATTTTARATSPSFPGAPRSMTQSNPLHMLTLVGWCLFIALGLFLSYRSSWVRWYMLLSLCFGALVQSKLWGGFDRLFANRIGREMGDDGSPGPGSGDDKPAATAAAAAALATDAEVSAASASADDWKKKSR
jgi:lysocardiolipin and lysophospholipid acyltransferase